MNIPKNPFNFQPGGNPAHFVGRTHLEVRIEENLESANSWSPRTPIMILGNSGVGKKVIINRAIQKATELDIKHYLVSATEFNDSKLFIDLLINKSDGILNLKMLKEKNFINYETYSLESILYLLERRLEKEPLLIIFNEVHKYMESYFQFFARKFKRYMMLSKPLSILFVGQESVRRKWNSNNCGFLGQSHFFYLNHLSESNVREALAIPFTNINMKFEDYALNLLVKATDGHPLFIQKLGYELWESVINTKDIEIDLKTANLAIEKFNIFKNNLFNDKLDAVYESNNKVAFLGVIKYYYSKDRKLNKCLLSDFLIDNYKEYNRVEVLEELEDLGIICTHHCNTVPTFPSFINYVVNQLGLIT